jgi:hypothetical protein
VSDPAVAFINVRANVSAAETRAFTMPVPAVGDGPFTITLSAVVSPVTVNVCSADVEALTEAGVRDCEYTTIFVIAVPEPTVTLVEKLGAENVGLADVCKSCGADNVIVPSPSFATVILLDVPATHEDRSATLAKALDPFVATNRLADRPDRVKPANVGDAPE